MTLTAISGATVTSKFPHGGSINSYLYTSWNGEKIAALKAKVVIINFLQLFKNALEMIYVPRTFEKPLLKRRSSEVSVENVLLYHLHLQH